MRSEKLEYDMPELSIREILEQVSKGQIRIPAFQRGFVWEPERVAYLMDSIYKKFPFGSVLFWRTREILKFDRKLGPFELPNPPEDYPVDYVLDGQQRITSIFGVFQTDLDQPTEDMNWLPIYFDPSAEGGAQESQFVALSGTKVDQLEELYMILLKILILTHTMHVNTVRVYRVNSDNFFLLKIIYKNFLLFLFFSPIQDLQNEK